MASKALLKLCSVLIPSPSAQYAAIRGGFLTWDFWLKDELDRPLAKIDRNWSGLGTEIFTDAGTYVVHFGCRLGGLRKAGASSERAREDAWSAGGAGGAGPTSLGLVPNPGFGGGVTAPAVAEDGTWQARYTLTHSGAIATVCD